MKIEKVIKQLESILDHTRSMAASPDADDIWRKDIDALKFAITALRSMQEARETFHIDRNEWTAEWIYPENEWNLPRCSKCGCNSKDATYGHKNNFCPKCGRAMTEEAWAELERRLRMPEPPKEE